MLGVRVVQRQMQSRVEAMQMGQQIPWLMHELQVQRWEDLVVMRDHAGRTSRGSVGIEAIFYLEEFLVGLVSIFLQNFGLMEELGQWMRSHCI